MTIDSADDSKISNRTINTNRISNRTYDSKSNWITKLHRSLINWAVKKRLAADNDEDDVCQRGQGCSRWQLGRFILIISLRYWLHTSRYTRHRRLRQSRTCTYTVDYDWQHQWCYKFSRRKWPRGQNFGFGLRLGFETLASEDRCLAVVGLDACTCN